MTRMSGHPRADARRSSRLATIAAAIAGSSILAACGSSDSVGPRPPIDTTTPPTTSALKDLASRRGIVLGAAVERYLEGGGATGALFRTRLTGEFSAVTPGNDMKHERLAPSQGSYSFAAADAIVAFAQANGMRVRGHTLVWGSQIARWVTTGTWTQEQARTMLTSYITTVAGHFKGKLLAWDVVNEPLNDDGSLKQNFWATNVGADYIELAFRTAHAADPDVPLFLNDYNLEYPGAKADAAYTLVRDLRTRGVPIDGIGFQAHFIVGTVPSRASLAATFKRFADLGLKVHITELDIRIRQPSTSADLTTQASDYATVVRACLDTPGCESIVTWGLADSDSWVPQAFPGWGEPLLFDAAYAPKPAYYAFADALK